MSGELAHVCGKLGAAIWLIGMRPGRVGGVRRGTGMGNRLSR